MSDQNPNEEKKNNTPPNFPNKPKGPKFTFNFYWLYVALLVVILGISIFDFGNHPREISRNKFYSWVKAGDVDKIKVINKESIDVYIKKDSIGKAEFQSVSTKPLGKGSNEGPHYTFTIGDLGAFEEELNLYQKDITQESRVNIYYENNVHSIGDTIATWIFPISIVILTIYFIRRMNSGSAGGNQIFNIGKSKATLFDKDLQVKVTFNDVAGLEEAKVEVMEIVDFLKNPKKYTQLGGKIPRGALLVGPPGTGKTLLAKAVAGEAQVPFFSLSGSDFVEMFVGVGASRVRDLFRQAKEKAPCIIFIDEIDSLMSSRSEGENEATRRIKTEFLK